jgi:hypothetical protein
MSVVAFRPFMSVTVEESGSAKPIGALRIDPTATTARRLSDYCLIFRSRPNGFQLYAQHLPAAGDARLAPITARTPFVFGVWLTEPDLLARYHPDLSAATGSNLYLSNLNADGSVRASGALSRGAAVEQADAARIVGRRLITRVDLPARRPPTSLRIVDHYDSARVVTNVPIDASAGSTSASVAVDLSADRAAAYTAMPRPAGSPQTTLYVDDELAGRRAFAVIELVASPHPGPPPAAGRKHVIAFRRRS